MRCMRKVMWISRGRQRAVNQRRIAAALSRSRPGVSSLSPVAVVANTRITDDHSAIVNDQAGGLDNAEKASSGFEMDTAGADEIGGQFAGDLSATNMQGFGPSKMV